MVYVIKGAKISTVFTKIDMKQHKNTCFSSCLWFLWNKSRNSRNYLSKLQKISLIRNPDPRAKKVGRNPDIPGSERCESPGVAREDGQAWDWLIHKVNTCRATKIFCRVTWVSIRVGVALRCHPCLPFLNVLQYLLIMCLRLLTC